MGSAFCSTGDAGSHPGKAAGWAVWDSGEWINQATVRVQAWPAQQWTEALQPFHRLDSSRGQQGHCGLGLAIVAHVARLHGGRLECLHPEPGSPNPGTFAIRLSLPLPMSQSEIGSLEI